VTVPPIERLLDAFSVGEPTREGPRPPGLSAVLLPLYDTADGPALLYEKRASDLRSHPGEVSFPGGRVDPGDKTPRDAALREAREEVGLEAAGIERLSHLADYTTFRGTLVCAYVARVRSAPPERPASPREVERLLLVPLARLLDPAAYEARRIVGAPRERVVHYWHLQPTIWGITGELTAMFLERAAGWTPPGDRVREIARPEEFLPR
jgi:8-oxo-dGTP pyrophosphatase MutT (NUDIX family)